MLAHARVRRCELQEDVAGLVLRSTKHLVGEVCSVLQHDAALDVLVCAGVGAGESTQHLENYRLTILLLHIGRRAKNVLCALEHLKMPLGGAQLAV